MALFRLRFMGWNCKERCAPGLRIFTRPPFPATSVSRPVPPCPLLILVLPCPFSRPQSSSRYFLVFPYLLVYIYSSHTFPWFYLSITQWNLMTNNNECNYLLNSWKMERNKKISPFLGQSDSYCCFIKIKGKYGKIGAPFGHSHMGGYGKTGIPQIFPSGAHRLWQCPILSKVWRNC